MLCSECGARCIEHCWRDEFDLPLLGTDDSQLLRNILVLCIITHRLVIPDHEVEPELFAASSSSSQVQLV